MRTPNGWGRKMNSKTRERRRQIMQDIEKPSAAKPKQWFDLLWQEDDALDWLKSWEPGAKMRINDETAYGRSSQNNQRRHEQFNPSNEMEQAVRHWADQHSDVEEARQLLLEKLEELRGKKSKDEALGWLEANGISQTASKSQDKHSGPSSRGRKLS